MTWAEISPVFVAVATVVGTIFIAASTVAAVLFGVWRMIENHKKSNETDRDKLSASIKEVGNNVQNLVVTTTEVKKDVEHLRKDVDWHLFGRPAAGPPAAGPQAAPGSPAAGSQAAPGSPAAGPQAAAEPLAAAGSPPTGS